MANLLLAGVESWIFSCSCSINASRRSFQVCRDNTCTTAIACAIIAPAHVSVNLPLVPTIDDRRRTIEVSSIVHRPSSSQRRWRTSTELYWSEFWNGSKGTELITERLYFADAYRAHFSARVVARGEREGRPIVALDQSAF